MMIRTRLLAELSISVPRLLRVFAVGPDALGPRSLSRKRVLPRAYRCLCLAPKISKNKVRDLFGSWSPELGLRDLDTFKD